MAGYSGTPLPRKLGLKDGQRIALLNAPASFANDALGPLPDGATLLTGRGKESGALDFVMLFADRAAALEREFAPAARRLAADGMLWVAWPKRASRVPTDLTEDVVRRIGLAAGLVDVKVCAVDEVWSGLKFVRRLRDR